MYPSAPDYDHPDWRPPTRFPISTSSSRTNLVLGGYANRNFGSAISLDARSIGASTQCSGKSRRRKRLQRKRRPGITDLELTENLATRGYTRSKQDLREFRGPVAQSKPQRRHTEIHTPSFSEFLKQRAQAAPNPSNISDMTVICNTPPQRYPSDCSRYTVSRHSSSASNNVPRSDSIYHKAVLALPRNTEYFLELLEEDLPAPLVPLKIRPASKAPLVPQRQASKRSFRSKQSEGDNNYVREWDQGWEDFDTMLDEYQRSFSDEDTNALCAPRRYNSPGTSISASSLERWRSRWSDDSSEMSNTQFRDLALPPLAHLPDLDSDSSDGVSSPSSPTSRGPNTPYLQTSFSPFHDANANQSHISLCLAESRTPTSPRHHAGSHSLDSAQPKLFSHVAKHKQSASVCAGSLRERRATVKTLDDSIDVSIVQAEEAGPRCLEVHRRGGYEDWRHWHTREELGTAF